MVDRELLHGLAAGTRLVVSRRGYRHHGIYVGQGRVIHYAGLFLYPRGCVEEVALVEFAAGRPVSVGCAPDWRCAEDVVRRARSRLGERRYDLLSNNCGGYTRTIYRWRGIQSWQTLKSDSAY